MDEGSQRIASLVLEATLPGTLVLDACAGAGGKTLALASGGREVLALDVREGALRELERRAARAGVTIATRRIDPDGPLPADLPRAATVLVDAPCSGSGVLRRSPAQRFGLDDRSLSTHRARQEGILDRMSALVLPGGRLVYATCSVLREEDEEVVGAFLARHARFSLASEHHLWPHRDGTDGFYAAVLLCVDPGAQVGRTG
jgi:16S rRNA (cytosine967-C5)-methyltransferase